MRPAWVLSVPDGPHVGPMNLATRDSPVNVRDRTIKCLIGKSTGLEVDSPTQTVSIATRHLWDFIVMISNGRWSVTAEYILLFTIQRVEYAYCIIVMPHNCQAAIIHDISLIFPHYIQHTDAVDLTYPATHWIVLAKVEIYITYIYKFNSFDHRLRCR